MKTQTNKSINLNREETIIISYALEELLNTDDIEVPTSLVDKLLTKFEKLTHTLTDKAQ
tara:strand:- start:17576 stop:17752 length:177 start_codon:yes stop_codon:yes gene_type:complete